jgi:hypothetical protein
MGEGKPSGFTLKSNPRIRVSFDAPNQTEYGGAVLIKELMGTIGWDELLRDHLPFERVSGTIGQLVGYPTARLLTQIVMGIALGARRPEQIEVVREDELPRLVLQDEATASSVTVWRHLKEYNEWTLARLQEFRAAVVRELLKGHRGGLELDTDATVVTLYGQQQGAEKGYNPEHRGKNSYFPMVTLAPGPGLVLGQKLRPGNSGPGEGDVELLGQVYEGLGPGLRRRLSSRLDCGHWSDQTMRWHEDRKIPYAIKARQTGPLMACVQGLPWKPEQTNGRPVEFSEFEFRSDSWDRPRRQVVIRFPKKVRTAQGHLFEEEAYEYEVISTNRRGSPKRIFEWYNQRGTAETQIEDLKSMGYGLAVTDEFVANAVWSELVILAYNLLALLRRRQGRRDGVRPKSGTFRDRFLKVGAVIVKHARYLWVRFKEGWSRAESFESLWAYAARAT